MNTKKNNITFYNNKKDKNIILQNNIKNALTKGAFEVENAIFEALKTEDFVSSFDTLTNIVSLLTNTENLMCLVDNILQNENHLQQIQKKSYYHQNGFDKFVLFDNIHFKLRLHFFNGFSNPKQPHEHIHDHRWNFASKMIKGDFEMKFWEENPKGEEQVLQYEYVPAKDKGKYDTILKAKKQLACLNTQVIGENQLYYMPADLLHQITTIAPKGAITMILTGDNIRENCKLFAKKEIADEDTIHQKFEITHITKQLEQVKSFIAV